MKKLKQLFKAIYAYYSLPEYYKEIIKDYDSKLELLSYLTSKSKKECLNICRNHSMSIDNIIIYFKTTKRLPDSNQYAVENKLTKCDNCGSIVEKISTGEICPECYN